MRFVKIGMALLCVWALPAGETARSADPAQDFFDGKSLAGWEGIDKYWSVKDGALVGATAPDGLKFNTFLCSKKKYKDFELKFQVKLKNGDGNSGVQIRSKIYHKENYGVAGPQCDIGGNYWGSLYGEMFSPDGKVGAGMMKDADKEKMAKVLKKAEFNDYYILCKGKHVTIKLNGETMVDGDFPRMDDEGIVAWQLHAGGPMEVTFKNIEFKELK